MKNIITIICLILLTVNFSVSQEKKVLFEEFTNASCGPCAANNPALKDYIDSKGDTIVAIKYHVEFPGFDPMHILNPSQVHERRGGYYSDVNAVPWLKGDGDMFPDIWPFTLANFDNAFNTRKVIVPPLTISVSDERITADSIEATVSINIVQTLPAGDYKLRVMTVEKVIIYATPPGNNGETIFEHVFRKGYPNMTGTTLPTSTGTYQFTFKYKIEAEWIDTSMLTVAFVQNDASGKEVINCAEGNSTSTGIDPVSSIVPSQFSLHQNYPNPFNPSTNIKFDIPKNSHVRLSVFNTLGKEVKVLLNKNLVAGTYDFSFNAEGLSSGVYFCKLAASDFVQTMRMVVVK